MTLVGNDRELAHVNDAPVEDGTPANRRAEPRHPPSAVPEITSIRLSPGETSRLINISATGLLVESLARHAPGGGVTVHFDGAIATKQIKGRVVRCHVSAIAENGALHYQTAVAFKARLRLAIDEAGAPDEAATSTPADAPDDSPETLNRW
jgi:hypothetical protein